MGGSGSEMSSKAMVSLMPGRSSAGSGSWSPSGWVEGVADGGLGVGQRVHGLGRVDDPAALGQPLQAEALAVPEQGGWRRAVDVEHESGPGAHRVRPFRSFRLRRSKAILTAPRRPAAPAWAMASS